MPAELHELKPEQLHEYWPFLKRGVDDIHRRLKPNWLPEDIFSALRTGQMNCVIARHGERLLGFLAYSRQLRLFSYRPEIFVWLAWSRPMREWLPEDDMPAAVTQVWKYVSELAKSQNCPITWITSAGRSKAFARKFGWQPTWVTFTVSV